MVQQSPKELTVLAPGSRLHIYAILQGKIVPKCVTRRGISVDGAEIELAVQVTTSNLSNAAENVPPPIHALAAREIIQDLQDGRYDASLHVDSSVLPKTFAAHIVCLGKAYSISSSHTSFIAVDGSGSSYAINGELFNPASFRYRRLYNDPVDTSGDMMFTDAGGGRSRMDALAKAKAKNNMDILEVLARLQNFDAGFSMHVLVLLVRVDENVARDALPVGTKDDVVATVFTIAFPQKRIADLEEEGQEDVLPWDV